MSTFDPRAGMDRYTAFAREWVGRVGGLALDTNDRIDNGTFDYATWAKSMQNLADFGLGGAIDLAPDLGDLGLPCLPCHDGEPERSDYLSAGASKVKRRLSPDPGSFRHAGDPAFTIPDHLITFEEETLEPLQTMFRIAVYWADLRSGTYYGRVCVTPVEAGGAPETLEVTIDL